MSFCCLLYAIYPLFMSLGFENKAHTQIINMTGSMHYKEFKLEVSSYSYIQSPPLGNFVERRTKYRGLSWGDKINAGMLNLHAKYIDPQCRFPQWWGTTLYC